MRYAFCSLVLKRGLGAVVGIALTMALACVSVRAEDVGDKTWMVSQLSLASPAEVPPAVAEFARRFPRETSEVALDLIVHRWMTGRIPDIQNADLVIGQMVTTLRDPRLNWARKAFSARDVSDGAGVLPPEGDERAALLLELKSQYASASNREKSSPAAAVAALTRVLDKCQKLQIDISQAHVLSELGDHYFRDMHRYRDARTCYEIGADILTGYQQAEASAAIYSDYGELSRETGNVTEAVEHYTMAAQYWDNLVKRYPTKHEYRRLAGLAYMQAGRAQRDAFGEQVSTKALDLMGRGIKQFNDYAVAAKSYRDLIESRFELASIHRSMNEAKSALDCLEAARKACNAAGDQLLTARLYDELAATYTATGQADLATEAQRKRGQALKTAADQGTADLAKLYKTPEPTGKTRDALLRAAERGAEAFSELGQYSNSAAMWEKLAAVYKKSAATSRLIRCLRSLASAFDHLEKPQDALGARLEAVTTARSANDNALAAIIGREMVDVLLDIGDLRNAMETFTDLALIFQSAGDVRGAAAVLEARGGLLAKDRQYAAAIRDLESARNKCLTEIDDPWAHGGVSLKLAAAYRADNKPADALRTLETAIKEIESRYDSEDLDPNADDGRGDQVMSLYRELAIAYVKAGDEKAATSLFDQGRRYRWIAELVRKMRGSDDPVVAKFALGVDIVNGGSDSSDPVSVPSLPLAQTWGKFALECIQLQRWHPAAYNALPVHPRNSLYGARLSMPQDVAIIEYMPTASSTYVFVCGADKPVIRQLNVRLRDIEKPVSDLRRAIRQCEGSLSAGIPIPKITNWREQAFLELREPLSALYEMLVKPIEEDIKGKRLLAFALPDELAGVPMHALVSSGSARPPRFLLQDYEISFLGNGMLKDLVSSNSRAVDPATDRVAIFADPGGNLPGARAEAAKIQRIYPNSESYVGAQANRANLKKEAAQATIIHIAAHHWIDPNPAAFAIQLARDGESDGRVGVEQLTEFTTTRLGMVVLSACDSISSSDPISTGTANAAEAFSQAGARSVLGGLWKVSDDASAKIMVDFYRGLTEGLTRTQALRRALLDVIQFKGTGEYAHPFFWACFALYGNPR